MTDRAALLNKYRFAVRAVVVGERMDSLGRPVFEIRPERSIVASYVVIDGRTAELSRPVPLNDVDTLVVTVE